MELELSVRSALRVACGLSLVVWLAPGCRNGDPPLPAASAVAPTTSTPSAVTSPPPVPSPPVIGLVPDLAWNDLSGHTVGTSELRGRLWLAVFVDAPPSDEQRASLASLARELLALPNAHEFRLVIVCSPELPAEAARALALGLEPSATPPRVLAVVPAEAAAHSAWARNGVQLIDFYGQIRMTAPSAESALSAAISSIEAILAERLPIPDEILNPPWLAERAKAQLARAGEIRVPHDFRFTDRSRESGLTFRNKIVDDAGRLYEAAHYDHGNGVVTADVDGDGHSDLYFLSQAGGNELWRNRGDATFENITAAAGVGLADRVSVSAAFGDIDNDGDPDLFVTTVRQGNVMFENLGNGKFQQLPADAGFGDRKHSSGAVFFDYNRDGFLDLYVCNVGVYTQDEVRSVTAEPLRGEPPTLSGKYYRAFPDAFAGHLRPERDEPGQLFRNTGNKTFVDVSAEVGLIDETWSGDATPCDVNEDGWPDLYVLNMQGHDEFYLNRDGKTFERKSREYFPNTPWGSMGAKFFDFDNDGRQDLFITDMHSDMSREVGPGDEGLKSDMQWPSRLVQTGEFNRQPGRAPIFGNALFLNRGDGRFDERSDGLAAETYWPWGLSVGDLNADGYDDAFVTASMNYPFRYAINSLLLNDRGELFRHSEFILGVEPRLDGRTATPWFDLDCAGRERNHPLCVERNFAGRRIVWSSLGSKSSVLLDLDADGDLDIVTNEVNERPLVLVSDLAQTRSVAALKILLRGTSSNRDGLMAVVTVTAGGETQRKVFDGASGYLSHSLYPLYFGLGDRRLEQVRVVWPSGAVQTLESPVVPETGLLTITEPELAADKPAPPQ